MKLIHDIIIKAQYIMIIAITAISERKNEQYAQPFTEVITKLFKFLNLYLCMYTYSINVFHVYN